MRHWQGHQLVGASWGSLKRFCKAPGRINFGGSSDPGSGCSSGIEALFGLSGTLASSDESGVRELLCLPNGCCITRGHIRLASKYQDATTSASRAMVERRSRQALWPLAVTSVQHAAAAGHPAMTRPQPFCSHDVEPNELPVSPQRS